MTLSSTDNLNLRLYDVKQIVPFFGTKGEAKAFAKKISWSQSDIVTMQFPLGEVYSVAQRLLGGSTGGIDHETFVFPLRWSTDKTKIETFELKRFRR